MRRLAKISYLCAALLAAACVSDTYSATSQFWRPISEPNLLMPLDHLQTKLDFDIGQCHCGIYPANATHDDMIRFSPDKQRLIETSVTVTPDKDGQCVQQPSLVVTECMRQRGWEPTNCSGRLPLPNGGSLCTTYQQPSEE